jgi:phage gp16-like protein
MRFSQLRDSLPELLLERGKPRRIERRLRLRKVPVEAPPPVRTDDPTRAVELKKLHVAKLELAIGDDTWRIMCHRITRGRTTSSGEMNVRERRALIEEMKAKGFKEKPARQAKPLPKDPMVQKMLALWLELKAAGALRDASDKGLRRFANRIVKKPLEWMTTPEAAKVIEALKSWLDRENAKASAK